MLLVNLEWVGGGGESQIDSAIHVLPWANISDLHQPNAVRHVHMCASAAAAVSMQATCIYAAVMAQTA